MENQYITEPQELNVDEIELVSGGVSILAGYYGVGPDGTTYRYRWIGDSFGW